jgi:ABC-type bacteriocin/lantibiotic exporter with double-glycine peptidase domain
MKSNNVKRTSKFLTNGMDVLLYVIQGSKRKFVIVLISSLLANAFITIANPLSIKYLFDEGIIRGNFSLFITFALLFIVIFTLWRLWIYFNRLSVQKLKVEVLRNLSRRMITKYYEIPYREIIKRDSGYYVSRVYDEVSSSAQPTIDTFLSLFANIIIIFIAVVIVLTMSWRASLAILLSLPLIYLVSKKYNNKIKELSKIEIESEADLRGILTRSISSFKLVKVFSLKKTVLKKIEKYFDDYAIAYTTRFRNGAKYEVSNGILMSYAETLALIVAGYEMLAGRMTFGGYMAFMSSYWMTINSLRALFSLVPEISRLGGSIERLKEFENLDNEKLNINYSNFVKLDQVYFGYEQINILNDISFNPNYGDKILIVGANGSGKSTLAHIISGMLAPSSGSLTTFSIEKISAVIYPLEFIPGSVMDNVSFVSSEVEKTRLNYLLNKFELTDLVDRDATELSAGQRKKVEIMIGLVKQSDVYVFDEPLAGIDVDSKEVVMNEIFNLTEGKTLFVIMHGDESFHDSFDQRVYLDNTRMMSRPQTLSHRVGEFLL